MTCSTHTHLEQGYLHIVLHQIQALSTLAAVQVIRGDVQGDFRSSQSILQALLLGQQQVSLVDHVTDLSRQLGLPEVNILASFGQLLCHIGLCIVGRGLCLITRALGLVTNPLGLISVYERLVVLGVVSFMPLTGVVLGGTKAHGSDAHVVPCVSRIHQLHLRVCLHRRLRGTLWGNLPARQRCCRHFFEVL